MGGIFGGAGGTPPAAGGMTGFDANAVAQALMAAQGGGGDGRGAVTGGSKIGNVNPLAQMLAAQGPAYQPGGGPTPTGWGMAGDRLARYTPQGGVIPIAPGSANVPPIYTGAPPSTIDTATGRPPPVGPTGPVGPVGTPTPSTPGGAGGGGYPPINPGEDSMAYMLRIGMSQADAEAALAMSKANPGMSFQDIMAARKVGGGGAPAPTPAQPYINWGQLGAQLDSSGKPVPIPAGNPQGDPRFTDQLKPRAPEPGLFDDQGRYTGPEVTMADLIPYREAWKASVKVPENWRSLSKAEKDAWQQRRGAAEQAYVEMQKRTGYGPAGYVRG
jgi:hypothetical protein